MGARPVEPLRSQDVIKTYRYLRIGMIGAVVLLAVSILIERSKVDCWQDSVSAYYYTPVRAIFVGSIVAVGLSLIVYKGRSSWEDILLNGAGMLAPVVAIAPTTDVGDCFSIEPIALPTIDDSLAPWVVANVDNNFLALVIAGGLAVILAFSIAVAVNDRSVRATVDRVGQGTLVSLGIAFVVLIVVLLLSKTWDDFYTRAHGYAAVLMFAFLIGAIVVEALAHRGEREKREFRGYAAIAGAMVFGAIFIPTSRIFGTHTVFALEAFEIVLFAIYWGVQTRQNWNERVEAARPRAP